FRRVLFRSWRATVGLVVAYVPSWVLITAATWCTARALVPDPPLLRIGIATALSWTAGFVAVPVPAAAGVREAVLLAASGLPAGPAPTVAAGSRLAFLVVEVLGAGVRARALRAAGRARRAPAEPADPDREPAAARP